MTPKPEHAPQAHSPTHLQTPPLQSALPESNAAGLVTSRLWDEDLLRGVTSSPSPSPRGSYLVRHTRAHIQVAAVPSNGPRACLRYPLLVPFYHVVEGNRASDSGLPISLLPGDCVPPNTPNALPLIVLYLWPPRNIHRAKKHNTQGDQQSF